MCTFFSFLTDPINKKVLFFNVSERRKIISGEIKDIENPDSHSSIAFHFRGNGSEDKLNKYEFNPITKVFTVDQINSLIDDRKQAEEWVKRMDKAGKIEAIRNTSNSGNMNSGNMNSGDMNSGNRNSGDMNSGDMNSGYMNSGNMNSGNMNSGYMNSGYMNSGNMNSGNRNSGNMNSGNMNSGYRNSGDMNSGNRNSGMFNSNEPAMRMFNKDTDLLMSSFRHKSLDIIYSHFYDNFSIFVATDKMTDDEKTKFPSHKTTGGYLRKANYKECFISMWENLTIEQKKTFETLPNFDWTIFTEITGIVKE
jgi:hypothetical protein